MGLGRLGGTGFDRGTFVSIDFLLARVAPQARYKGCSDVSDNFFLSLNSRSPTPYPNTWLDPIDLPNF